MLVRQGVLDCSRSRVYCTDREKLDNKSMPFGLNQQPYSTAIWTGGSKLIDTKSWAQDTGFLGYRDGRKGHGMERPW